MLNVAFAGLTSATVSPAARRFGLIAAERTSRRRGRDAGPRTRVARATVRRGTRVPAIGRSDVGSWAGSYLNGSATSPARSRSRARSTPSAGADLLVLDAAHEDDEHVGTRAVDDRRVVMNLGDRSGLVRDGVPRGMPAGMASRNFWRFRIAIISASAFALTAFPWPASASARRARAPSSRCSCPLSNAF